MLQIIPRERLFAQGVLYRVPDVANGEITEEVLNMVTHFIRRHEIEEVPRLERLQRYYLGEHEIGKRVFEDSSKPNNKLAHDLPKIITNQLSSHGFGKPISYTCLNKDEQLMDALQNVLNSNQESSHNLQLAKTFVTFGKSYELCYVEGGEFKFTEISVNEAFIIYDTSVNPKPLYGVRYYDILNWDNTTIRYVEIYGRHSTNTYQGQHTSDALTFISSSPQLLGTVPLICYQNNREMMGDWENQINLIDAYNLMQSDSVNEFSYFADCYLVVKGMHDTEPEDMADMKQRRLFMLDGEGADAKFLVKESDFESIEAMKDRLKDDIFGLSGALDMDKLASVSNVSGSAIRYKLLSTESNVATKEEYFRESLDKRLEMITTFLNLRGSEFDHKNIQPSFVRNLPLDLIPISDFASKMYGIVSHKTLLSQMDFIKDPARELRLIAAERQERVKEGLDNYDNFTHPAPVPEEEGE